MEEKPILPAQPSDPAAAKIVEALRVIQQSRTTHDQAVKEATHFVIPRKSDMREIKTMSAAMSQGGELAAYANLFTRAARAANQGMAAGIFSYLTPKNQKWFKITTGQRELDESLPVYAWFDNVRDVMLDLLARSNFSKISHETYLNFGAIGTVCSMVEWDDKEDGIFFTDFPYNTFWFTEDDKERPNRVFREFLFTGEQAVEKWGEEKLEKCSNVLNAYYSKDQAKRSEQFKFVHLVEPNKNQIVGNIDDTGKPYASTYVCEDGMQIIEKGGFTKLPYKVARFLTYNTQGNVMGYSPAMDTMPSIKVLEKLYQKFLFAVEKNLNPAMSRGVTIGMVPNQVKTAPNAVNNFDARNPDSKPTPILQQIDLSYGIAELEDLVKKIEDAFYIPTFQAITNIDKSNATATEIIARKEEALVKINPSVSNIEDEWLELILTDVFAFVQEKGLIPEPPIELSDTSLVKLEFTGVLSSAPKLAETSAIFNYFEGLSVLMNAMPDEQKLEVINSHNYTEIVKTLQQNNNFPARFRYSDEEIEKNAADQQAQQQQAIQQQELMKVAGGQDLNKAPEDGSVMAGMV